MLLTHSLKASRHNAIYFFFLFVCCNYIHKLIKINTIFYSLIMRRIIVISRKLFIVLVKWKFHYNQYLQQIQLLKNLIEYHTIEYIYCFQYLFNPNFFSTKKKKKEK